jgi:hypothetical protein
MRKTRENSRKHAVEKQGMDLTPVFNTSMRDILKRLDTLETRIEGVEEEIFGYGLAEADVSPKRRGARRRINNEYLLHYRNDIALWLETVWPNLVPLLFGTNSRSTVDAFLRRHIQMAQPRLFERRLIDNLDELFSFLKSKRFVRRPSKRAVEGVLRWRSDITCYRAAARFPTRQIANAMAGVPDISWRRSLDRSGRSPCPWPVQTACVEYYRRLLHLGDSSLGV